MGLFSRNKKNGMFDKNIEPKCAYCENGKPARSKGKILCPRCGIVESDYSCKKFKYSPFLRIPERGQEAAEESAKNAAEPESMAPVSESAQQSTESVGEIKETSGAEAQSAEEPVSENVPTITPENSVEELSNETQTDDVSAPEEKKTETPFPAYIYADEDKPDPEPEQKSEKQNESKRESVISAEGEGKTASVKADESEFEPEKIADNDLNLPKQPESSFEYVNSESVSVPGGSGEVSYKFPDSPEYISKTVRSDEEKILENKDIKTEIQQGSFSNINNKPSDNSENIAKLESVQKLSVSSIDNYIQPVEINLPKISESAVSSIENKPQKRNAEEYLKTISVGNVSEIENHVGNVHDSSSEV